MALDIEKIEAIRKRQRQRPYEDRLEFKVFLRVLITVCFISVVVGFATDFCDFVGGGAGGAIVAFLFTLWLFGGIGKWVLSLYKKKEEKKEEEVPYDWYDQNREDKDRCPLP